MTEDSETPPSEKSPDAGGSPPEPVLVAHVCYPEGKAYLFTRGDPAWTEAAKRSLAVSIQFVPVYNGRLFLREMEDQGAPLDVAWAYDQAVSVRDEVYVRHRPGEEPPSRYKYVGIRLPPREPGGSG